ncbi:isoprenyl transferase [Wielerella bovis]|uniref:isoprenyl transferase n=1 Tax=Wielerella bovis TaxID=2917790 RepID=UPI002019DADD|nr:isoprenyl transferase [Wielerella bovis]ULJ60199.1 isoprenyl transferase [Wielerella bovis]ULJ64633.1 isoprenyl transferase [Wielerella bovis]ULJ66905.1 isoprenyl transferase [Wielerella bovis]ULJ69126.1 isoprenyl transferase [Wielerella bovis]
MSHFAANIPEYTQVPRHVAVIMDGNGRWAKKRLMPRMVGHKRGLDVLEDMVRVCSEAGVSYLTVFAFSTENWRRPAEEVSFLMGLFLVALQKKVIEMNKNGVRLRVIGDRSRFSPEIQQSIVDAEQLTANNTGITLTIAADYGGRWDIVQAANALIAEGKTKINEADISQKLMLADAPEPDLFIRTGGETRISNFMLWQMAYAEFYFTDVLWPDFDAAEMHKAFASFQQRERRFGRTSEQLPTEQQRV